MSLSKKMYAAIKMMAPGTLLRFGIDNVLHAKTGGLIVLSDSEAVREICRGGFTIDMDFNPARLYELAKMDGAIILDEKSQRIWKANVQLLPTTETEVFETGIRHRTAARTAVETGAIVVAVSQRRSMITIYCGEERFVIEDSTELMSRASLALRTLERYWNELQEEFASLTFLEFGDNVYVDNVVKTVQRCEMVQRIVEQLDFYLLQMGSDGLLVEMQKKDLAKGVNDEYINLLLDYVDVPDRRSATAMIKRISELSEADLNDSLSLAKFLGFGSGNDLLDVQVHPGGYRILDHIPRLPQQTVAKTVEFFKGDFQKLCQADVEELDEVEGIGRTRANLIRRSLSRQRELSGMMKAGR